ncbi:multiple resistance and pH regulation protein F [candidate division KSB1 bacterium]|nr:multiple resistance and pH regulation protein F [candidate division KSB1 bacterium]RQW05466.1 MAG: multiple resistance and pH regulation protein F [candidate division KSB1 bacterium]
MRLFRWMIGVVLLAVFCYFNFFVYTGQIYFKLINVILVSALFVLFRVIFGPSPADRIVAVDILGVLIVGMLALLGLQYDQGFLLDIGLIWALLSFIASLAFAKILEGRSLDD